MPLVGHRALDGEIVGLRLQDQRVASRRQRRVVARLDLEHLRILAQRRGAERDRDVADHPGVVTRRDHRLAGRVERGLLVHARDQAHIDRVRGAATAFAPEHDEAEMAVGQCGLAWPGDRSRNRHARIRRPPLDQLQFVQPATALGVDAVSGRQRPFRRRRRSGNGRCRHRRDDGRLLGFNRRRRGLARNHRARSSQDTPRCCSRTTAAISPKKPSMAT